MISNRKTRFRPGFTLIELMVTMAILTIILGMALQVTESARFSIRVSEAKSINDGIARKAFDQISRDISQMVVREDARIEFKSERGNDKLAFLTNARGLTSGTAVGERVVCLVTYELADDTTLGKKLLRGSRGHQFEDTASDALNLDPTRNFPAITPDNLQAISHNIIRLEAEYLVQGTGTDTITREIDAPLVSKNLKGIIITLATLDDRGRRAVRPDRIETLAAKFNDATVSDNTLETWSKIRDDLAIQKPPAFPKDAIQSVRCYQRTILIP
jgi:prepilin-type N-terminal cleavage/methylation domain-containing protein